MPRPIDNRCTDPSSGRIAAIRQIGAGRSLLDPAVKDRSQNCPAQRPRLARLSDQERRILHHLAEGKTNRQIATEFSLSEKTIKNYVSKLLRKMAMSSRTEAAVYAARRAERHSQE